MESKQMNKKLLKIFCIITFLIITLTIGNNVIANGDNIENLMSKKEYSKEYKEYLELSDEEKKNVLMPRMFDIDVKNTYSQYLKGINNKLKVFQLLKGTTDSSYNLKTYIPENVKIRNQKNTNSCWAFSTIAALESNLAIKNYKNGVTAKIYDYSERHMMYASTEKSFINGQTNPYGWNREISDGGNYFQSTMYLTNGSGAILEDDMPFVNTEEDIDISLIQNKEVQTTLIDTTFFPTLSQTTKSELMSQMKSYITNYGGIAAQIYGASLLSDYYNNQTGAIYCDAATDTVKINHGICIIGWDDNYSKDNFNSNHQPSNNGAWIIKNSWGEKLTQSLSELKATMYEANKDSFNQNNINSAEDIPNEFVIYVLKQMGYGDENQISIEGDNINIKVGDNGYMYVSYDDVFVYEGLYGIQNAKDEKDYDEIYQNDPLGYNDALTLGVTGNIYLSNVFKRDSSKLEELSKISVFTIQGYTCKVYVNPNGSSKNSSDLQEVQLAAGESETIEAGYHTIEFAKPIKLTGDSFAVVLEVSNNYTLKTVTFETKVDGISNDAIVNAGESFVSLDKVNWVDTSNMQVNTDNQGGTTTFSGNLNIKAFTNKIVERVPTEINVTTPPNKVTYVEGENFDRTGMIVKVKYNDSSEREITEYTIVNDTNLTKNQTSVTISYTENNVTKTTEQAITVTEKATEPPVEEKEPISSDFNEAKANLENFNISEGNSYCIITIKLEDIKIGSEDTQYKYYYYLSGTKGDTNINEGYWVEISNDKITKEQDGTYSILLQIDSRNVPNSEQITNYDNLFIYIKEIATIGSKQKTMINTLEVVAKDNGSNKIDNIINSNNRDNTISSEVFPHTGFTRNMTIIIIGILAISIFLHFKYKNIDK